MKLVLCGRFEAGELQAWQQALCAALPEATWLDVAAARAEPFEVTAAVVANPAPGSLQGLGGLRLIQSLWAGVDRLLSDPTLPAGVPVARMVDPAMASAMAETALWATLALQRGFFDYAEQQRAGVWRQHAQRRADEVRVTVLGAGQMGVAVATRLAAQGYVVSAWVREARPAAATGLPVFAGPAALQKLLPQSDIVINLLPLTAATHSLLDAHFFNALPAGAALVNLGRGAHLVDADLLAALDGGRLSHAVLDVFHVEPLPAGHAFWAHPRITLLPHAAALTDPRSAALVVAANLRALHEGRPLAHLVDRERGY